MFIVFTKHVDIVASRWKLWLKPFYYSRHYWSPRLSHNYIQRWTWYQLTTAFLYFYYSLVVMTAQKIKKRRGRPRFIIRKICKILPFYSARPNIYNLFALTFFRYFYHKFITLLLLIIGIALVHYTPFSSYVFFPKYNVKKYIRTYVGPLTL